MDGPTDEFKINDRVIVDWRGCLYEAKIINIKQTELNKNRFKVHFINWNSSHDEWKEAKDIFPRSEENLRTLNEQRAYIAKHNVKPGKKGKNAAAATSAANSSSTSTSSTSAATS